MPEISYNLSAMADIDPQEPKEKVKEMSLKASSVGVDNSTPIKRYWRSGREMLRMANIYREEQSLEKAFILYMKYITLFVEKLPQHSEYKNCEPNERALTKTNCKQIIPIAEQLKTQLLSKYEKEFILYSEQKKRRQLEEEKRTEKERQEMTRRREEQKERELQELQLKLNKQIEEKKERPDLVLPNNTIQRPLLDLREVSTSDWLTPSVDRSTKPSVLSVTDRSSEGVGKVVIPQQLVQKFLLAAKRNTANNIETCAILAGRLGHNAFTITHVLVPKQTGSADSCQTDNEEEVFLIQDKYDLLTIGWIHTHPTQSAFMSSIDLHTHCSYQLMLPEAIAIVCAPKLDQIGVFSLTDPYGLQLISSCRLSGFHPHPTQPPIYEQSSHLLFDDSIGVELIDLR